MPVNHGQEEGQGQKRPGQGPTLAATDAGWHQRAAGPSTEGPVSVLFKLQFQLPEQDQQRDSDLPWPERGEEEETEEKKKKRRRRSRRSRGTTPLQRRREAGLLPGGAAAEVEGPEEGSRASSSAPGSPRKSGGACRGLQESSCLQLLTTQLCQEFLNKVRDSETQRLRDLLCTLTTPLPLFQLSFFCTFHIAFSHCVFSDFVLDKHS